MKLISLYIENFGKLNRWSLDLSGGLNTVCEENGWGKSTLAAFLKAMFYGLPKNTRRDLDENERKKYTPWQGGTFGGNVVFECARGTFRVERSFGETDSFALIDLATGLPSDVFSEALGQELFGIDADGFERSVYVSARSLAPSGKNDTVRAKLTGMVDDVNDMGNYERARDLLESRAKEYRKTGNRGKIGELDERLAREKEQLREKRVLLAGQKEQERKLSAVRGELETVNAEDERVNGLFVLATRAEDKNRREQELRSLEARKTEIEQSFAGGVPSAAELSAQQARLNGIALDAAELRHMGLNEGEQNELVRLSAVFSSGAPDAQTMERQFAVAADLHAEKIRCADERAKLEQTLQTARERERSLPAEAELRDAAAALDRAEKTSRESAPQAAPRGKLLFAAALILSLAGIAALIYGVPKGLLPVTVGGGAALIAGLICLMLHRFGGGKTDRSGADAEDRSVRDLLSRYGNAVPEGTDPRPVLSRLSEECERNRASIADAEEKMTALLAAEGALRTKENDLRAFLARYAVSEADPDVGLRRLSEQSHDWDRLFEKQRVAARASEEKRTALNAKLAEADRFFARYPACLAEQNPERRMSMLTGTVSRYASCAEQIAERRSELAAFVAENGLLTTPETPAPDLNALRGRAEQIRQKKASLSEQERELSIALDRSSRETEKIPELEESISRLSEKLADAKDRYRLLKLTCDYLKEAQEALTTRYLAGTRESFGKYLTLLAGGAAPQAEVNAEFGVTVVDSGMTRPWESYSRGWRDILQFCVRLSLVDALFKDGETPFLLLDDPFTNLDEKRLVSAKELLGRLASQFQVLYLVCHADRT